MPCRAWERQDSGAFSPFAPGSMAESGTSQSLNARLEVTDARMDHLPWISEVEKPEWPRSTRKPRMPSSLPSTNVRAQTRATSATEPFVIQVFSPLSTQFDPGFDPERSARV